MSQTASPANSATATSPVVQSGLEAIQWSRGLLMAMLENTPDEHFYRLPCPGGNHAAWVAGHIAYAEDGIRVALGGGQPVLDAKYKELFGGGTTCREGAAGYPSRQELMDALATARKAATTWFAGMTQADLAQPVEGGLAQLAKTKGGMMHAYAGHEAFHAGQASMARRAAGLPPLF